MFYLGHWEIMTLVIILIVFGAGKLPKAAENAKGIKFKRGLKR